MDFNRPLKLFVIFSMIFAWIFSGWPQIWPLGELGVNKIRIPPAMQEVKASPGVVFQNSSEVKVSSATSITIPIPTGWSVGDLLIAYITKDDDETVTLTSGSAWNTLVNVGTGGAAALYVAWKFAEAGDTQWTWTESSEAYYGVILRYTGHNTTTPIHAYNSATGETINPTAPSVAFTNLTAGSLVLQVFGADHNDAPYTVPSQLTSIFNDYIDASGGTGGAGGGREVPISLWVSPTGFNDPDTAWELETNVYDGNLLSHAYTSPTIPVNSWSSYLELTIAAISCSKVRFYAERNPATINQISVDVYYSNTWHNIYEGTYTHLTWVEKEIGSIQTVTAMRMKFYNDDDVTARAAYFKEANFWKIEASTDITGTATFKMNASEEWAAATVIIEAAVSANISVSVSDGIITYGTMAAGTSKTTLQLSPIDTQTLTNDGNVTETFNIKGQDAPCPWTLAATAGTDQYVHQFCKATDVSCASPPTNYTALTTGYVVLYTGVASSTTRQIDLRITTPTSTNCFTSQAVDITIQAVQ